jgi:hypothetical protein
MKAEKLEQNALEQRERLERTTHELAVKVAHTKPSYTLRKHFGRISVIASAAAFLSGWIVGAVSGRR